MGSCGTTDESKPKEEWPKGWMNPSEEYLKLEKRFKGTREHITDEQTLAIMIFKGYRLTRTEYSVAVSMKLILGEDTDKGHKSFMAKWGETETQFGRGLAPGKHRKVLDLEPEEEP